MVPKASEKCMDHANKMHCLYLYRDVLIKDIHTKRPAWAELKKQWLIPRLVCMCEMGEEECRNVHLAQDYWIWWVQARSHLEKVWKRQKVKKDLPDHFQEEAGSSLRNGTCPEGREAHLSSPGQGGPGNWKMGEGQCFPSLPTPSTH